MTFHVEDFQDLVRLLEARPEWRTDLRRVVLTDELLALPVVAGQSVTAQAKHLAQTKQVWQVIDRGAVGPQSTAALSA